MAANGAFLRALSAATYDLSLFGHKRLAKELWEVIAYHQLGADGVCLVCAERYPCATLKHLSLGLDVDWSRFVRVTPDGHEVT